ncbi:MULTISPECIES: dethiobiotin synthase [unclassified Methylophaga]|jgi:dethiobiotin synthetase|uniref:dethiobiotin synthase n=1 Tax=unclassified Methylophaga TaxID=2629249 RepID=UPI000C91893D|nr:MULTISPECIES: dethiobiotin synthase [unclassified Methylophaga]MAK67748.1 dethiobiotin synthase [Methylophaga sp.]MAY18429.1 dethiobiotin synthase [Methylophaga sp.]HAO23838.1 dethiobiotin synthase [Methylophaga sp.]|tara:strand:- start:20240 stop:20896 length:657 start_codon:yes stop_codon:yes gene_type:complete
MTQHIFVTGTDTEVGKTRISVGLIKVLQQQGLKVAAMKPIASGCEWQDGQWKNEDALALSQQADIKLPYSQINPYAFEPAIAPHLAAEQVGQTISLNLIETQFAAMQLQADAIVVEGAGGWLVPLNDQQTIADLAKALQLPVVLVVAIKLGCINHALLTVQAIAVSGLTLAGWVANDFLQDPQSAAIIRSLADRISSPCLGIVPKLADNEDASAYLNL